MMVIRARLIAAGELASLLWINGSIPCRERLANRHVFLEPCGLALCLNPFAATLHPEDRQACPAGSRAKRASCRLAAPDRAHREQFPDRNFPEGGPAAESASACPFARHACRPCPADLPDRSLSACVVLPQAREDAMRYRTSTAREGSGSKAAACGAVECSYGASLIGARTEHGGSTCHV
jgi:hypothetical protein